MTVDRPICVLISALGGQGGGVLADWLVAAARTDGFPAQATSIPGVAQRTGATTYYFEVFPDRTPPADPVFSLFPSAGDVDLVAALEPTEAARALALGFVGATTTVVTTRERVFSAAEKMVAGDGTIAAAPVLAALAGASRTLIDLDVRDLARRARSQANAVLLGAVAETGVLPLGVAAFRAAIAGAGVAVEANLAGFDAGRRAAGEAVRARAAPDPLVFEAAPPAFANALAELPAAVRAMAAHGIARLIDFQDPAYARLYLDRLKPFVAADDEDGLPLANAVARRLAVWMAFEDVIRVAQLKTRPGRLARIRGEVAVAADAPFAVVDFLKPGREELEGLLPAVLTRLLPPPKRTSAGRGLALRVKTSAPAGFLAFRTLAALRRWRRRTVRFAREQAAIEQWLARCRPPRPGARSRHRRARGLGPRLRRCPRPRPQASCHPLRRFRAPPPREPCRRCRRRSCRPCRRFRGSRFRAVRSDTRPISPAVARPPPAPTAVATTSRCRSPA